jgi:enamine deaminase RidA (YjgF/YER057c/UK114 family)
MKRTQVGSGAPWESIVGYSRAVRVGDHIAVTGTVATNETGEPLHPGDAAAQTRVAIDRIEAALCELGASLADVARTRIYVVDIARDWEAVGRAHGERFNEIRPATTMVEVSGLIDPGFLVEIEADAIVAQSPTSTR